jgi:hypothetical protein
MDSGELNSQYSEPFAPSQSHKKSPLISHFVSHFESPRGANRGAAKVYIHGGAGWLLPWRCRRSCDVIRTRQRKRSFLRSCIVNLVVGAEVRQIVAIHTFGVRREFDRMKGKSFSETITDKSFCDERKETELFLTIDSIFYEG